MDILLRKIEKILQYQKKWKKWQKVVASLACVIVFITTYALILPAITMDRDEAQSQGGISWEDMQEAEETVASADTQGADQDGILSAGEANLIAESDMDEEYVSDSYEENSSDNFESDTAASEEQTGTDIVGGENAAEDDSLSPETVPERPAVVFDGVAGNVTVHVEAPEGAFPTGTTMQVESVADDEVMDAVLNAVEDSVTRVSAVDIIFLDAFGNEIEPEAGIRVSMSSVSMETVEQPVIVHVDDEGVGETVESEQVDGAVVFESDSFSVYVLVETERIAVDYLTDEGETYKITVEFDERETVSDDMTLEVSEIPEGTYSYDEYLQRTVDEMCLESAEEIADARFFDIEIKKAGERYEPDYPVKVTIQYVNALDISEEQELSVIHFADEGTELITDVSISEDRTEVVYSQNSFSVAGTILSNDSSNSRVSSMMLIVSDGNKYYAVDKDLVLHEINASKFKTSGNTVIEFLEDDFSFDDATGAANVSQLAPYLWGRDISTGNNHIQEYHNADGEYLQLYPNNGQGDAEHFPEGIVFTSKDVNTSANRTAIILSSNAMYQQVARPASGKWPNGDLGSTKDFFLRIDNSGDTPKLISSWSNTSNGRANVYFVKPNVVQGESGSTGGGSGTPEDELGAPSTEKHLADNQDGTYTLSLSVTGESKGATEAAPGDVLLVMDISNSMKNSDMQAAKEAAIKFSGTLLGNPNNKLKLALETYAKTVTFPGVLNGFTSDQAYFEAMVNTITSDGAGETNWGDALSKANNFFTNNGSGETAPKYVVFITDGKPNAYGTSGTTESYNYPTESSKAYPPAQANALALKNSGAKMFIVAVESSESTQLEYNAMHQHVKKLAKALYDDENAYYTANEATLIEILTEIAAEINKEYSYKKVTIQDGITGGSVGTGVNGTVGNFTYTIKKKDGTTTTYNSDAELRAAYPGIGTASFNKLTGNVSWPLGDNYKLEDGTTYTVSFTVWPSQEAYDAIADIKNGKKTYADVIKEHSELADTLTESGDYVTNKENSAKVIYNSYVTTNVGEATTETPVVTNGEVRMQNPDPQPLSSSAVTVQKEWVSNMSGTDAPASVILGMNKDNAAYLSNIVLRARGEGDPDNYNEWQATRHLSLGILLSADQVAARGLSTQYLKSVTYKTSDQDSGTTYYCLTSGHDYQFTEGTVQGFELEDKVYHPMLVDGTLVDVTVGGTDQNPVYTLNKELSVLTATNMRRGGINISKEVLDKNGITAYSDDTVFSLKVNLTAPKYSNDSINWTNVENRIVDNVETHPHVAWYHYVKDDTTLEETPDFIHSSQNNDGDNWLYLVFDEKGKASGNIAIKAGYTIRFVNMASGTKYDVSETVPAGYEESHVYEHVEWKAVTETDDATGGETTVSKWVTSEDAGQWINDGSGKKIFDPSYSATVYADQQNNVKVTNKLLPPGDTPPGTGTFTPDPYKTWQIVSQGGETAYNYARVHKTITKNEEENKFSVKLWIDLKQQSLVEQILANGDYGMTHSTVKQKDIGTQVSNSGTIANLSNAVDNHAINNGEYFTKEPTEDHTAKYTIVITNSDTGEKYVVTRYAVNGSFNNGGLYVRITDNGTTAPEDDVWLIIGNAAKSNGDATAYVTMTQEQINKLINGSLNADIGKVVDTMGSNITLAAASITADGTTSVSGDAKTITWDPVILSRLTEGTSEHDIGWYLNVAQMTYDVTLTPKTSTGLLESGNSLPSKNTGNTASTELNSGATYEYVYLNGGTETMTTAAFPKPYVRGMHYSIKVLKKDSKTGAALQGATFTLYSDESCTQIAKDADGIAVPAATTDSSGYASFGKLLCGNYYVKETQAPENYNIDETSARAVTVGYFDNTYGNTETDENAKADLQTDLIGQGEHKDVLKSLVDKPFKDTHKVVPVKFHKKDSETKNVYLDNASFELHQGNTKFWFLKSDNSTIISADEYAVLNDVEKEKYTDRFTIANGETGLDLELKQGIYKLVEKTAPDGYIVVTSVIYFKVEGTQIHLCDENGTIPMKETQTGTAQESTQNESAGITNTPASLTVYNKAGKELPSTGGIGTTIFYAIGAVLVIGAGIVLGTCRRMNVQ